MLEIHTIVAGRQEPQWREGETTVSEPNTWAYSHSTIMLHLGISSSNNFNLSFQQ